MPAGRSREVVPFVSQAASRRQRPHQIPPDLLPFLLNPDECHTWIPENRILPCPIPALDWVTGIGGLPRGHVVEILGPENSGKTTLALLIAAKAQASGATVAIIDAARQLDWQYAFTLGIVGEELLVSQPSHAEQAFGMATALAVSGVDLVIVDFVSALVSDGELNPGAIAYPSGSTALALLRSLQRQRRWLWKSDCCLLFLDQIRDRNLYPDGTPELTVNTRTLEPFSSIRLDLRNVNTQREWRYGSHREEARMIRENEVSSVRIRVSAPKNRIGNIGRSTEVTINTQTGQLQEHCECRFDPEERRG